MTPHKVLAKSIELANGSTVHIKYWTDATTVYVAGFDENDKKITTSTYSGYVDIADCFDSTFQQSLIDGLSGIVESDLITNPELHYRP
jgi:hypothetical protein